MKQIKMMISRNEERFSGDENTIFVSINFSCSLCKNSEICANETSCKMMSNDILRPAHEVFCKNFDKSISCGYDKVSDTETLYVNAEKQSHKAFKMMSIIQDALNKNMAR